MSKIVSAFPQGNKRAPLYPFDEWLDGNIYELERGEDKDFLVSPEGIRSSIHNYAKRNGIRVRTKIRENSVFVQALEPEDDDPTN
jgi:hypothetical protein